MSGNQSLEKWLRQTWMPLYHTDPNGLIMYEYKGEEIYPTYKSINSLFSSRNNLKHTYYDRVLHLLELSSSSYEL